MTDEKKPPEGPTEGEKRNGWTKQALHTYLAERDDAVNSVHGLGMHFSHKQRRVRVFTSGNHDPWDY